MNEYRPAHVSAAQLDAAALPVDISVPLEVALTEAVQEVAGVSDVFAPAHAVAQLPQIVTALIAGQPEQVNRVRVRNGGTGVEIDTRIGVDRAGSAQETAREVAAALLSLADAETTVSVQVSRIA